MRKIVYLITLFLLFNHLYTVAQKLKINPTPQSIQIVNDGKIDLTELYFKTNNQYQHKVCSLLNAKISENGVKVYVGTINEKWTKKYAKKIKPVDGAYFLKTSKKKIVVVGYNQRGVDYGLTTLSQLTSKDNKAPNVEITDYPDIKYRGVVEGFYGTPWSHEDRLSLLNFFGENKLNVYIYGPKDDPYHSSPLWREPYPVKQAENIKALVKTAKQNSVNFVWAIHPGKDIKWNNTDRDSLINKFQLMYDLGVRSFALFFDDISGEGTDPIRQVKLLNYIDSSFIQKKGDCTSLIMCPTQYNKSWSDPKPGTYLDILGAKLNSSIEIMWTGDKVMSDITVDVLTYINQRIKRKSYIWWNFPVNDYARTNLLLGRAYGLDNETYDLMSGFVSNPMDKAEASKVAIYSIADFSWNTKSYDSYLKWNEAIQSVMPQSTDAYTTFSLHNSDTGKSYHDYYRREESTNIAEEISNFYNTKSNISLNKIYAEFQKIAQAPSIIRSANDNTELLKEVSAWLDHFEKLGENGMMSIDLYNTIDTMTSNDMWLNFIKLIKMQDAQKRINDENIRAPYQIGIKTGSLIMQPFVDTLNSQIVQTISKDIIGNDYVARNNHNIPTSISTLSQINPNSIKQDGDKVFISPVLEPISIAPNQYFGIKLPMVIYSGNVSFHLNRDDIKDVFSVEISTNGLKWSDINLEINNQSYSFNIPQSGVSQFKLTNISDATEVFYLKKFIIYSPQLDGNRGNIFMSLDRNILTSFTLNGEQTINNKLKEVKNITILSNCWSSSTMELSVVDTKGLEIKLSDINTPYLKLKIPSNLINGIKELKIRSKTPIKIYEFILE